MGKQSNSALGAVEQAMKENETKETKKVETKTININTKHGGGIEIINPREEAVNWLVRNVDKLDELVNPKEKVEAAKEQEEYEDSLDAFIEKFNLPKCTIAYAEMLPLSFYSKYGIIVTMNDAEMLRFHCFAESLSRHVWGDFYRKDPDKLLYEPDVMNTTTAIDKIRYIYPEKMIRPDGVIKSAREPSEPRSDFICQYHYFANHNILDSKAAIDELLAKIELGETDKTACSYRVVPYLKYLSWLHSEAEWMRNLIEGMKFMDKMVYNHAAYKEILFLMKLIDEIS